MVNVELSWEQTEKVVVQSLQESIRLEIRFDSDPVRIEAYKLVLSDYMLTKDFYKFMHELAKREPKYNAKRLTEANNGL